MTDLIAPEDHAPESRAFRRLLLIERLRRTTVIVRRGVRLRLVKRGRA